MPYPSWDEFAELALKRITASGAEYGDIRILHSSSQTVSGEDRRIASIRDPLASSALTSSDPQRAARR